MIKNEEGKIVLRFHQPIPKYIRIGQDEYVCDVRHGVSLLFVDENQTGRLLAFDGWLLRGEAKSVLACESSGVS